MSLKEQREWKAQSNLDRAWQLHEVGRSSGSADDLRKAIAMEPDVARFHLSLGQVLRRDGDDEAIEELAVAHDSGNIWIKQDAAAALRSMGINPRRAHAIAAARAARRAKLEEQGGGWWQPKGDDDYLDAQFGFAAPKEDESKSEAPSDKK